MSELEQNFNVKQRFVTEDNVADFAILAKQMMEEADHCHVGLADSGLMYVYPCGCEAAFVFPLHLLEDFVERRNVAVANGSQYDALHNVLQMLKQVEGQKLTPQPEVAQLSFGNQPRIPSAPAVFGEDPKAQFLQLLAEKFKEEMANRPKVWQVKASYGNEDGDEFGTLNFSARDLYEVADRLANIELQNGTFINIDLEYYSVED